MPLIIADRKFNTSFDSNRTLLLSNSDVKVVESFNATFSFSFASSANDLVQITNLSQLKRLNEPWNNTGLVAGDSIDLLCLLTDSTGSTPVLDSINQTVTITSIQGDILNFTPYITTTNGDINPLGFLAPQQNTASTLQIVNNSRTAPAEIELLHNITPNSISNSFLSIIDGETNKFLAENTDSFTVGQTEPLLMQGKKSGGRYVESLCEIERLADSSGIIRFKITVVYFLPSNNGVDFSQYDVYLSSDCLKSTFDIQGFPEVSNPNSVLGAKSFDPIANTGGIDEEYNDGNNVYTISSLEITNPTGTVLQSLDWQIKNTLEVVVDSTENISGAVELTIAMIVPEADYKNNNFTNLQNTYFSHKIVGGSAISSIKNSGQFTIDNDTATFGTNQVTLTFDIEANSELKTYIDALQSQQRLFRVTAALADATGVSGDKSAVTLRLIDGNFIASPIPDEEFQGVVEKGYLNHSQNVGDTPQPNYYGCTEDDLLFYSKMNIDKGDKYDQLLLKVQVERISDGAVFDLQSNTLNLTNVIEVNNIYQFNETIQLQQYLDAPNRNKIEFKNTGVTTATNYEVDLVWSIFLDWRYWLPKLNAFNDFYNTSIANNGKNSEWVRYLQIIGFKIITKASLVKDGIAYFIDGEMDFFDYDQSVDITTTHEFYDANGTLQNSLVGGQLMKIRAIHTLNSGNFDLSALWAFIAFRNSESDPRKQTSSKWDWTNQNLPLRPLSGQTKATSTLVNPNVLHVECLIDTSLVNVTDYSVVSRVQTPLVDSNPEPSCINPIDALFFQLMLNWDGSTPISDELDKALSFPPTDKSPYDFQSICVPECSLRYNDGVDDFYGFMMGNYIDVQEIFTIDEKLVYCCGNDLTQSGFAYYDNCTIADDFIVAFNSLKSILDFSSNPDYFDSINFTVVNDYTIGTAIDVLISNLTSFTSDEVLRFEIVKYICENGFVAKGYITGTNDITVV